MKTALEAKALLVRVLAESDAVWLPLRQPEWDSRPAAIYFAREAYRANRGVLVTVPGSDATRKSAEREITALVRAGYLKARHRARGRYLRLTDDAEDRLRRLCALPGLWLSYAAVQRHVRSDCWTPEIALNDGRGWGDGRGRELVFVEQLLLPALARGVAVSASTIRGHVYYKRIADVPSWPEPTEDVEPDPELAKLYHEEVRGARQRILATDVGALEIGELPLPCSMGDAAWTKN